jgi:hypothetical protein
MLQNVEKREYKQKMRSKYHAFVYLKCSNRKFRKKIYFIICLLFAQKLKISLTHAFVKNGRFERSKNLSSEITRG